MQKIVACFLLVLLVAVCIDAKRARGGRGRPGSRGGRPGGQGGKPGSRGGPGGRRGPGEGFPKGVEKDTYEWNVDVDSAGTIVPQKAFVLKDEDVVILLTFSRNLKDLNMTQSAIYMNTSSGMMIMRPGLRLAPCFVSTISATKLEIESDVAAWNDTTITLANTVALNGTEKPLTIAEGMEFISNNQIPKRMCLPGRIVETTAMIAGVDDSDTKTINFLGLNSQVAVLVPELPEREGPRGKGGKGRGGRGRGGRGQGGRRQGGRRGGRRG